LDYNSWLVAAIGSVSLIWPHLLLEKTPCIYIQ